MKCKLKKAELLNLIEECWVILKAAMKLQMTKTFETMMVSPPARITQTAHRLHYLEEAMSAITPLLCTNTYNHVQKQSAPTLAQEDHQIMEDNVQTN